MPLRVDISEPNRGQADPMEVDERTNPLDLRWYRALHHRRSSGSSFGPPPLPGKCAASSRDTASTPLITPPSKFPALNCVSISAQIFSQPSRPTLRVDTAIGHDLEIVVGQQQIDQDAVVVNGVPDPQLRKDIQCPLARRLIAKQRRASSAPSTTKRACPECMASPTLIACSILASAAGGKMRRSRQRCSTRCLPMRLMPMLPAPRCAAAAEAAAAATEAAAAARTAAAGP